MGDVKDQDGTEMKSAQNPLLAKSDNQMSAKIVPFSEEFQTSQEGRFEATPANKVVMSCKLRLLEV